MGELERQRAYLRCYIVRSELWGHQITLIDFRKTKIAQLYRSILKGGVNTVVNKEFYKLYNITQSYLLSIWKISSKF